MAGTTTIELPRENLLRGKTSGVALRAAGEEGGEPSGPVMTGHFAVFNQWTEINSWEGNFLEKFASGAFKKTIRENRAKMKVLFQHGYDYVIGDKPLGPITDLREDDEGAYYEVPLLDAHYVREELLPGLEAELYGASFRFRVIREDINEEPGASKENPQGLPERVVKEAHVVEFGPVTFPAYEGASAGLRSLEASELVAQAALERMEKRDAEQSHNLAARFATRGEATATEALAKAIESQIATQAEVTGQLKRQTDFARAGTTTSTEETEEVKGTTPEETVEPEVIETEGADDTPAEDGEETPDAPPDDSAEAEPHPDRGRRAQKAPLYGAKPKTPDWRL